MKYLAFGALSALGITVLTACAPISEDGCRAGNWAEIGVRDGARGAPVTRFSTYQQECAQFGITPNQQAWLAGREQGLKTYCTPHSAYLTGKRGRGLANVCPNPQNLTTPNRVGLRYHDIEDRIDDLKDREDDIQREMRTLFSGELTEKDHYLRQRYLRLLNDIDDDIDDLKREQRRLPVY